jgi:TolB-like protein
MNKCQVKSLFMLSMFFATAAFAINNVAVLELIPNSSIEDEISIGEFRHLTDELRRQAVTTLPKGEYSVLTRDNLLSLTPPDEKEAECLAESCAVDIGRVIGAEYISQGTIGKFGKKLTISVELYETMSGKLLSSIVFESQDIEGLLDVIRKEAKPLFQNILDLKALSTGLKDSQDYSSKSLNQVNQGSDKGGMKMPQWLGIGLAVAGIGMSVYGILQNGEYDNLSKAYSSSTDNFDKKWKDVEDAKGRRNIGYIIGSALLASGITVYFVF